MGEVQNMSNQTFTRIEIEATFEQIIVEKIFQN